MRASDITTNYFLSSSEETHVPLPESEYVPKLEFLKYRALQNPILSVRPRWVGHSSTRYSEYIYSGTLINRTPRLPNTAGVAYKWLKR